MQADIVCDRVGASCNVNARTGIEFKSSFRLRRTTFDLLVTLVTPARQPRAKLEAPGDPSPLGSWSPPRVVTSLVVRSRTSAFGYEIRGKGIFRVFNEVIETINARPALELRCPLTKTSPGMYGWHVRTLQGLELGVAKKKGGFWRHACGAVDGVSTRGEYPGAPAVAQTELSHSRKGSFAMTIQGLCDVHLPVVGVDLGAAGSCPDAIHLGRHDGLGDVTFSAPVSRATHGAAAYAVIGSLSSQPTRMPSSPVSLRRGWRWSVLAACSRGSGASRGSRG